jgi:hypothetical protein
VPLLACWLRRWQLRFFPRDDTAFEVVGAHVERLQLGAGVAGAVAGAAVDEVSFGFVELGDLVVEVGGLDVDQLCAGDDSR